MANLQESGIVQHNGIAQVLVKMKISTCPYFDDGWWINLNDTTKITTAEFGDTVRFYIIMNENYPTGIVKLTVYDHKGWWFPDKNLGKMTVNINNSIGIVDFLIKEEWRDMIGSTTEGGDSIELYCEAEYEGHKQCLPFEESDYLQVYKSMVREAFLPIVKFKNPSSYKVEEEELIRSMEQATLSKYLDKDKYVFNTWQLTTEKRKLKLPFTVKQGGQYSQDTDGTLDVKLSAKKENVKIISAASFKTQYNTEFELEIEVTGNNDETFYIDFYANDDTSECKDLHCGRVKVVFKYCICKDTDWPTLPRLLDEADKVKYGVTVMSWTDGKECYHYALHQLKNLGYWVKSERWDKNWSPPKEVNDHIYQLYVSDDVAGMTAGAQEQQFIDAMTYLKQAMKDSTPIMVGLDYKSGYANDDLTTDHFAVIVGTGIENDKVYFDVCDNAYSDSRYFCDCKNHRIHQEGNVSNIITQVRESK